MPRLQALLECVGQALCEKGNKALRRQWPYADLLLDIAKAAYENVHRKLPGADLRLALSLVGLVPLAARTFDLCLIAPLFHQPFRATQSAKV